MEINFGIQLLIMSDFDMDPGQLNEAQQSALSTYTAVTNQEPSSAIPLLQRSEWNVQVSLLSNVASYSALANTPRSLSQSSSTVKLQTT